MAAFPDKARLRRMVERSVRGRRPDVRPRRREPAWVMSDDGVIGAPPDEPDPGPAGCAGTDPARCDQAGCPLIRRTSQAAPIPR